MKRTLPYILTGLIVLLSACGMETPTALDGNGMISVVVIDTSGAMPGAEPGEPFLIEMAEVNLQARSQEFRVTGYSDEEGYAGFDRLAAGEYSLFARTEIVAGAQKKVFTGYLDITITGTGEVHESLILSPTTVNALMINEIHYAGSDYSSFYFYDQFVEIYNSADDTLYLDGIILTRNYPDQEIDQETNDFVRAIYAFQFPGTPVTGRDYPIFPHQYVVVASDAIDHSAYCSKAVDLSGADWEFFNALGHDYDVPNVPNLESIHPTSSTDFMINLVHNAIVMATGEEYGYEDYGEGKVRITLPLYTVIDGVEYATSSEKTKELTARVDAGFAGIGNSKYSGKSTERREVGMDTNNSTFDFVLVPDKPTPGYSHAE